MYTYRYRLQKRERAIILPLLFAIAFKNVKERELWKSDKFIGSNTEKTNIAITIIAQEFDSELRIIVYSNKTL